MESTRTCRYGLETHACRIVNQICYFWAKGAAYIHLWSLNVMRCAIWYHLYSLKKCENTHEGVLLLSHTSPLVFFTFLILYKWHQIAQHIRNSFIDPIVVFAIDPRVRCSRWLWKYFHSVINRKILMNLFNLHCAFSKCSAGW